MPSDNHTQGYWVYTMTELSRGALSEAVNRAIYDAPVIIERNNDPVAAIIAIEAFRAYEAWKAARKGSDK